MNKPTEKWSPADNELPKLDEPPRLEWNSDYLAEAIRATGIEYIALTPGASFRGLHDSLVNYLGNERPKILLCLHEEHAVAIAHGYAKVTERPMGAFVHSNVGLMHATMAVFNAWCDRVPLLLFGATGPVDAAKRRPWIDWIHTSRDQGALIRDYTKWDDQPASLGAAAEAVMRANLMARTPPCGPVYVVFDAELQEGRAESVPPLPDIARRQPPSAPVPSEADLERVAALLAGAKRPLILAGRVSRSEQAWRERVELAELLGARVLTDMKQGAAFPTDHPLHAAPPSTFFTDLHIAAVRESDLILSFDWNDLAGSLRVVWPKNEVPAKVIQISVDLYAHRGWGMEYQGLPPADVSLSCEPDVALPRLLAALKQRIRAPRAPSARAALAARAPGAARVLDNRGFAATLRAALEHENVSVLRLNLGWPGDGWHFRHPLDYLGYDGGAGIGSGPGMAVGSALALVGSGRIPLAVLGDGDYMMGASALWTATHYGIPLLIVVANNRSFFNDEVHQERMAVMRKRPVCNKWIGQRIARPDIDIAAIARAQGAVGIGPAETPAQLVSAVREALVAVHDGKVAVVDAHVTPEYAIEMAQGVTRTAGG